MKNKVIFAWVALAVAGAGADQTLTHRAALTEGRAQNGRPGGEYAASSVQAQLRVDVKEGEGAVRFVRDKVLRRAV